MKNEDSVLIQKSLDGDEQAFAALVDKYKKQVHALAWQKTGDYHIAEEITQDVFITAYQKFPTLTHYRQFAGWLYVVTNRKCIAWQRKKKLDMQSIDVTNPMELEEAYYTEYTERQREEAAKEKRRNIVQKLLGKLQESDRTVMSLYYLAEMSCEEIGKFLGMSPNTVRSRLHRARNRLRKEEAMIKESLSYFQLPSQMTENIMKEVSRHSPVTPSANKPFIPLAISAASALFLLLLLGIGVQNQSKYQQPYSIDATSKPTIEIVDARIVIETPTIPAINNQFTRSDVLSNNDGTGQSPDTSLSAAAQSDDAENSNSNEQWGQTNGPYGGDIRVLFATSEGILLVGTGEGNQGIFRSNDLGDSWSKANIEFSDLHEIHEVYILDFAQKKGTIYASVSGWLYASTDTGKTWHYVSTNPQDITIYRIIVIGNRVYISSYQDEVWYSDDGKTWKLINDGLKDVRIREFGNIGSTLILGTQDGIFRKKETEDSWQPINSGFSAQPIDEKPFIKAQIDSGFDPPTRPLFPSGIRVDSIATMDDLLYVGVYMGKDKGLFRSDDEGDSWTRITSKEMKRTVEALAVSESTLYASTFGGSVFRSNDKGDSWIHIGKDLTDVTSKGLVAISADTVFASTLEGNIFRTTDGGNSWVKADKGIMGTSVVDLEVLRDRIYAFTVEGRLLYSTDGGDKWEQIENSPEPYDFHFAKISALNGKLYIGALRFAPNSHGGVVGGVFQLDEPNNALIEIKTDREAYGIESMHIVGTTFYVGTQGQGVFLWNEGWDSWLNLGLNGESITDITVSDASIYARTQRNELFCLHDHQGQWEQIESEKAHRQFAESRKIDNKLYVLSEREGLIRSLDDGNSWSQLDDGIEHVSVETVEIDGTDFYIGTTQHGVFKWLHKDEKWEQIGSLSLSVQSLAVMEGFLYAGTQAGVHRIQIEK